MKKLVLILGCIFSAEVKKINDNNFIIKSNIKDQVVQEEQMLQYSLNVRNISLNELAKILTKTLNKKIINLFSSDLRISINLENSNETEIIDELVNQFSIGFIKTQEGYKIYPPQLISRVFPIYYHGFERNGNNSSSGQQRAGSGSGSSNVNTKYKDQFWQDLKSEISLLVNRKENEEFFINTTSKHITIKGMPKTLYNAEKIINKINENYKYQIILEGHIIQFTHTKSNNFNINWTKIFNDSKETNFIQDLKETISNYNSLGNTLTNLLKLSSQHGKVAILSSPRISMFNNQKSILQFGKSTKELQQLTIDKSSNQDGNTSSPISEKIKYELQDVFLGIIFSASANIINQNEVILHIHPMISTDTSEKASASVDGLTGPGKIEIPFKTIDQKQSDSIIKANNNDIIIIGGLTNTTKFLITTYSNIFEYFLPFLRSKEVRHRKEELIILIKVNIFETLNLDTQSNETFML